MKDPYPSFRSWTAVPSHLKSKTALKRAHLRPGDPSEPDGRVYQRITHTWIDLYDERAAVARPPATAAQRAALERARAARMEKARQKEAAEHQAAIEETRHHRQRLAEDRLRAARWARAVLSRPLLILDTETTGLDPEKDEIIEVAVLVWQPEAPAARRVRAALDTLVRPASPIPPEATQVHGLKDRDVASAASFAEVYDRLRSALDVCGQGSPVLFYNAAFDEAMLEGMARRAGLPSLGLGPCSVCVMAWYAQFVGAWNERYSDYTWQALPPRPGLECVMHSNL